MVAVRVLRSANEGALSRAVWAEVSRNDPDALPTQQPEWTDAVCSAGPWQDVSRLYAAPDGRRLVLPMVRRRGVAGAVGIEASMPTHFGFGGLLAEGGLTAADVRLVVEDLSHRRVARQMLRVNPLHGPLYEAVVGRAVGRVERRAHVLDLNGGADAVWGRFAKSRQRALRKAEREGVEVEIDATGRLLPEFFALMELSERRWAEQQHEPGWLARIRGRQRDTLEKWQAITHHLNGECRVFLARHNGVAVAAIVVLFGVNAHYTRGAMDKDLAGPVRANDLLLWRAIQAACGIDARWFHLGESGTSETLSRYKEGFGATAYEYPELQIERLPISRADRVARSTVKRLVGFREP